MSLAACTNENTVPEQNAEKEVIDEAPKRELVYTLNGEEITETDVDIVKINNTNIKMILPSSYTYSDSNSVDGNGQAASYSVSVTGKENGNYEGTSFYFENELREYSKEIMERQILTSKTTRTGLGADYEIEQVDSTKFDLLYRMTAPGAIIYFAGKTIEGNTHYISASIYDPEKLGYEDYLLKVLDTIEFTSEN